MKLLIIGIVFLVTQNFAFGFTNRWDPGPSLCLSSAVAPQIQGKFLLKSANGDIESFSIDEHAFHFEGGYQIDAWTCSYEGYQILVLDGTPHGSTYEYFIVETHPDAIDLGGFSSQWLSANQTLTDLIRKGSITFEKMIRRQDS